MKKSFPGAICLAAIAAVSAVLLPAAAVMIAVRLSKPRDNSKKYRPEAERERSKGFPTRQLQE
jgi:hypothetical protein